MEILESITDGVLTLDSEWRVTYMNAAAERLSRRDRSESLGKSYRELFPDCGEALSHGAFSRAASQGVTVKFDYLHPHLGEWFHVKAYPGPDRTLVVMYWSIIERKEYIAGSPNGQAVSPDSEERSHTVLASGEPLPPAVGALVERPLIRDLTELNATERAALLLGAIIDSSDDAILSKDLNGIITSWNQSAQRLFGYTEDEVVGKSVTILIPPDRQQEEPAILERLKRGERVDHFETVRVRKDGSLLHISLTISPVKDAHGRIIGASKIARDISDRKYAEVALRESEGRFRQLADSMPQMVWTARADGHFDYYNERWYAFTKASHDLFGLQSWDRVIHPDDLKLARDTWLSCVREGAPYAIESRLWDAEESRWRWFMGRALPIRNESGQIVKWFGTFTDIDSQKRVEEELRRANQDLQQFAYSASHDLQEPLRNVRIYTELLTLRYRHAFDGEALEFFNYIRSGATRMEALLRDLLAYTQVSDFEMVDEAVDANEVLREVLADMESTIVEGSAHVASGSLPRVRMYSAHLKQLFQNLVGNAIKYRRPGCSPAVYIDAKQQGDMWLFSVKDNGIGVDPAYKEHIFGLFKRLHSADEYPGTGIGLAICQRIVEQYNGRIWVESKPGEGSTFAFTIPV